MAKNKLSWLIGMLFFLAFSTDLISQDINANNLAKESLSRIVKPDIRKNITAIMESVTEQYGNMCQVQNQNPGDWMRFTCEPKSKTIIKRPLKGKLELKGLDVDYVYTAFGKNFEFWIDSPDSQGNKVIRFSPKLNLELNSLPDKFVNRAKGFIYIDPEKDKIIRIEGYIDEPFSFFYLWHGIPVSKLRIHDFRFMIEYQDLGNFLVEKSIVGLADFTAWPAERNISRFTNNIDEFKIK